MRKNQSLLVRVGFVITCAVALMGGRCDIDIDDDDDFGDLFDKPIVETSSAPTDPDLDSNPFEA